MSSIINQGPSSAAGVAVSPASAVFAPIDVTVPVSVAPALAVRDGSANFLGTQPPPQRTNEPPPGRIPEPDFVPDVPRPPQVPPPRQPTR